MDKINSDNFVEMNAYTLEHRILVTGNTKANWEYRKAGKEKEASPWYPLYVRQSHADPLRTRP